MNALDILSYVMLGIVIILGIVIMIWGTIEYRSIYNPSYEELFGNNKNIDSTIKKYPFHGGCMCCTKFHKHGHSYCNNCRYYKDNLNLKDIGNSIENFSNYSNRNIKSLSGETIENHINNLTIQEALDIVDKKVEGRK